MNHRLTTIDNFFNFDNFDNFERSDNFVTFYNRPPTVVNVISFLTAKVVTASATCIKKQKTALFFEELSYRLLPSSK